MDLASKPILAISSIFQGNEEVYSLVIHGPEYVQFKIQKILFRDQISKYEKISPSTKQLSVLITTGTWQLALFLGSEKGENGTY